MDQQRQNTVLFANVSGSTKLYESEGDTGHLLQREEFTLGKHGWIAFGQPLAGAENAVEYFVG